MFDSSDAMRSVKQLFAGKANESIPANAISRWANNNSMSYVGPSACRHYMLGGELGGKPWTIERRSGSRAFIRGDEINGRAALDLLTGPVVIVMNRSLKESLEKQAYEIYTDPVQTLADPSLSEEMRWVALYPECPKFNAPIDFRQTFSVLAGDTRHPKQWVSNELIDLVMTCQAERLDAPFVLMLLRGKVYLQMEFDVTCDELSALKQSCDILQLASSTALQHFVRANV